ncbi:amidohydrolase [Suillus subalutaceus]|uniref:amidohydrolase n=1 Tax=Suillus subalutaceus TaxID=48586 RepID=UPI001B882B46|nr:amidohydrolase [Suillus subalutaceus]KAG1876439.1 amidohydrolase [Suillus subalutaceus]
MSLDASDANHHSGCLSLRRLFKLKLQRVPNKSFTKQANSSHICDQTRKASDSERDADITDLTSRVFYDTCCDFGSSKFSTVAYQWEAPPVYSDPPSPNDSICGEIRHTIETMIDTLDSSLRLLSLQIHSHPELMFEEIFAHKLLSDYMESHGFSVTRHYLGLKTAWKAEYTHGQGGRTIGINSEMDALPEIGHACGHNLIAISGVGVALAIKSVLETYDVPGTVVLLGTPAEEGGGGKIILLERGAYKGMDACLMCHPSPGPELSSFVVSSLAMQSIDAEFFGKSAHAGDAPWEGANALDAAFLAYSSVSVLRQQIKPDHRVNGVINGSERAANVIPDYAKMRWYVRAPTRDQLTRLTERVSACFEGAALATSCRLKITKNTPYYDLRQNSILAAAFSHAISQECGSVGQYPSGASTDFGNVSYVLPSLHPAFAIPTQPNGGNHSPAFADSARTAEAHKACMITTKALACTGFRVLADKVFFMQVREAFEASM